MAAATTIYPDALLRPATRAIYAESVDSRNREPYLSSGVGRAPPGFPTAGLAATGGGGPLESSSSDYIVRLENPVSRVGTLQIGDFSLGAGDDPRLVFEPTRCNLMVSEPIHLRVPTNLTLTETVERSTLSSLRGVVSHVVAAPVEATAYIPPTMNPLMAADGDATAISVSTLEPHGLDTVFNHWPPVVASQTALRATRFYNADPLVHPSLGAATVPADDNVFTVPTSYLANTLSNTVGTSPADIEAALYSAPNGGFLHVPRLTVPELVRVVDGLFADLHATGSFSSRLSLQLNDRTGEVEMAQRDSVRFIGNRTVRQGGGVTPDTVTVREDAFLQLSIEPFDALWWLGFDPTLSGQRLQRFRAARERDDGTLENDEPYVYRFVPRAYRTIALPLGNPESAETLVRDLQERLNAVWLDANALNTDERTLRYENGVGLASTVDIPPGWWRPRLLAEFLSAQMAPIECTFDPRTARFTFRHTLGAPWALDFTDVSVAGPLARRLGFALGTKVRGLAAYTSESPVAGGVFDDTDAGTGDDDTAESPLRQFPLTVTVDAATNALRFSTAEVTSDSGGPFFVQDLGSGASGGDALTLAAFSGSPVLVTGLRSADVIRVTNLSTSQSFSLLVSELAGTAAIPHSLRLDAGTVVIGAGPSDDLPSADTASARVIGRTTFLIHAHRLPARASVPATNPFGYALARTGARFSTSASGGLSSSASAGGYGPAYEPLGLRPSVLMSNEVGTYLSPIALSLVPPSYFLIELVEPRGQSTKHLHRSTQFDGADERPRISRAILMKVFLAGGRISEEMTFVNFTTATDIERLHLRFLNPDLTLCDMHGREHNFTVLLRAWEGSAGSPLLG